jgi:hypothetical protein
MEFANLADLNIDDRTPQSDKMNITQFNKVAAEQGYQHFPNVIFGGEKTLGSFVDFNITKPELKIHLAELIICRCFPATGGIPFFRDADWFIDNFLYIYKSDPVKPFITEAIREAIVMIRSEEDFTKGVIGTTFMFGVLEHYAKIKIGFKPSTFDFFDGENLRKFRNTFIGEAFTKLKKTNSGLAKSLNAIDKLNHKVVKEYNEHHSWMDPPARIEEKRFVKIKIADRLVLARNTMLHGESHSFYDKGKYLVMLYILFYLHESKGSNY